MLTGVRWAAFVLKVALAVLFVKKELVPVPPVPTLFGANLVAHGTVDNSFFSP
jgi:hypothetical protein